MAAKATTKATGKPKKKRKPTGNIVAARINERRFFDAFIGEANFNGMRAYMIAHPHVSLGTARAHAPEIMRRIGPMLERWLDEVGLSDRALKTKLVQLLDAKEKRFFPYTKGDEQVITEVEVEALPIQAKMLELSMKAKGMLSEKSSREIRQIDELIAIELAKLALAGQTRDPGAAAAIKQSDIIDVKVET